MADAVKLLEKSSNKITTTISDEFKLPVTDSVVKLTVVDQNQEIVPGVAFPQTMVSQGNGVYEITLPGTLEIIREENYWLQVESASPTRGDLYQEKLGKCTVQRG